MSNLALAFPPLIGREQDLRDSVSLLARTRLLTLTGPGGCGKTSLALHVASILRSDYPDGVWVIELAPLSDPASVPEAACSVLRAGGILTDDSTAVSTQEQVIAALRHRDRDVLLVLDNCEHVISACADFIEAVLRGCPRVRILATSREVLKCQGEAEWLVPSLELPPSELPRGNEGCTVAELHSYAAIQLFVERARATVSTFDLTSDNAELVARICRRLDGLPLALELAARYVKVLSLQQIEDAIAKEVRFLAGARRTAPERQRTLHATMDWSYRLLARDEQVVFCRLCALAGDFGVQLAEAITDLPREQVIASLTVLTDASLVQAMHHEDEARYRILETVKQFGRHQLVCEGDDTATFGRYGCWAETYVASTSGTSQSDKPGVWLDRLEREHDHLRAALYRMYARLRVEQALHLATQLIPFWRQRGYIAEGRRWLDALLAQCDQCDPTPAAPIVAKAYNGAGVLALWQCEYEHARNCHETALAILQQSNGDASTTAMTRFRLGFLAEKCEAYAAATQHLEQSLLLYREIGDVAGEQMVRSRLGLVYDHRGDHVRAKAYLEESLAFQRAHGATDAAASILLNLGIMALQRGRIQPATSLLEESLALNQLVGDRLATLFSLTHLGFANLLQDEPTRAEQWFRQALGLARADGNREILVRLLDGLAMVADRQGDPICAARLWGSIAALRAAKGMAWRPSELRLHERALAAARLHVQAAAFAAAWEEGAALSLEATLTLASAPYCPSVQVPHADDLPEGATATRPAPELRIKALGVVHVWRGERELVAADFVYAKTRELLLYLLNSRARTKEQICLALWPDADQAHAHMRFRVVLYHLRRALGRQDWIVRSQNLYSFNRSREDAFAYDVDVFEAKVAAAERLRAVQPRHAIGLIEAALALYEGEYAESLGATDWTAVQQDALRQRYHNALLALASLHLAQGEVRLALATFQTLTAQNKYAEEAHRGVIQCYMQLHDFSRAAEYYQHLCAMFDEELGISPAPETRAALQPMEVSTAPL